MERLIILVLTLIVSIGIILISNRRKISDRSTLGVLVFLLFSVYLFRLFSSDVIDQTFNIFLIDIRTDLDAETTWLFSPYKTFFILILRWLTVLFITGAIAVSFHPKREVHALLGFLGPLVFVLNVFFFRAHVIAFEGTYESVFSTRALQFSLETVLFGVLMLMHLRILIRERMKPTVRDMKNMALTLFLSAFAVMPLGFLYHLFGNYGEVPKDFTSTHIFVILVPFALIIGFFYLFRKKSQTTKDLFVTFLAFAAFFQYFYLRRTGLNGLPLHLCNTAVILLVIAIPFRIKSVFYFAYFANVIGAIAAIILPNYSQDIFRLSVVHFGYNHLYALIIPLLAVILHTFPKPKLKHMVHAIIIFTIYFIFVVIVNTWFRNYGANTDYFFTYSDFLTDLFGARKLQYNYTFDIRIWGLELTFFYLFQIIYYLTFIFLMFMMWVVYDTIEVTVERHHRLHQKQREHIQERVRLKAILGDRNLNEPMNPENSDMIRISHFSKRYGNAKEKAVDDFSLDVHKGEVFGFLGHNGAGKSTTIKSLVGIQSITEGEIEICGYDIRTQPLEAKLRIGYVSDNHAVYEKLTGREYIDYVADLYHVSVKDRKERLDKYLKQFNLEHAFDQEIKSYSHGMKQKLVVIASLIHEPDVWILDEPLTGLDPTSAYQIKESMREHAEKGNIVFFSSHVIEVVEKICHRIAIINNGRLIGIYTLEELKQEGTSLEELYMKNVRKVHLEQ